MHDIDELLARDRHGGAERAEGSRIRVVGAGLQRRDARMRGAINPEVVLAILPREGVVVTEGAILAIGVPAARQVASAMAHLDVVVHGIHARALHRPRQEGQGRWRLDHLPRGHDVVEDEPGLGLLAQHLEDLHRGPSVQGHVIEQDVGLGRVLGPGGDVQVVAGGEGHPAGHDGVLLVGVVAREVALALPVDRALGLA